MAATEALINAPEFTVTELSSALKRTVEDAYGHVRVRGEITGFRGAHSSGHCYFALKDESAKIEAVIWKFAHARMRFKPQEGLEVIATGKLTTYPGSSKYQIVIESLEPAGIGALMALMEERKKKLAAEGLFDEARKQLLPWLPEVIGVVTSPTGAVIRDILHRLEDRFPRRVLVWPVRVQGEGSAEQVASAIRGFNALPEGGRIPRPDLLIVARGGGSLEDLWSFNEEIVVRAAADSMIMFSSSNGGWPFWVLRNSSNICFQAAACTTAVLVTTPSMSNRQAVTPSGRPSMSPPVPIYDEKPGLPFSSAGSSRSLLANSSMLTSLKVTTRTFFTKRAGRYMSQTQASCMVTSKKTSPLSAARTFRSTSLVR